MSSMCVVKDTPAAKTILRNLHLSTRPGLRDQALRVRRAVHAIEKRFLPPDFFSTVFLGGMFLFFCGQKRMGRCAVSMRTICPRETRVASPGFARTQAPTSPIDRVTLTRREFGMGTRWLRGFFVADESGSFETMLPCLGNLRVSNNAPERLQYWYM